MEMKNVRFLMRKYVIFGLNAPQFRYILMILVLIELRSLKMKENIILLKTIDFSVGIKKYCEVLYFEKRNCHCQSVNEMWYGDRGKCCRGAAMQKADLILSIK